VVGTGELAPGTHLDLVGSFGPEMREGDDAAICGSSVLVETLAGALAAGDLAQAIERGLFDQAEIRSDLVGLVTGAHPGRSSDDEITVFKSAGSALADLAATRLVLARTG
jgi:ornithine cyclodeaminase